MSRTRQNSEMQLNEQIEESIFFSLTHLIRSLDSKLDTNIFSSESTKIYLMPQC